MYSHGYAMYLGPHVTTVFSRYNIISKKNHSFCCYNDQCFVDTVSYDAEFYFLVLRLLTF